MQDIFVQKPYEFVPPGRGKLIPTLVSRLLLFKGYVKKKEGVAEYEVRHADRIRASIDAGHGVIMTPNHSRTADPIVMGFLAKEAKCLFYSMASWHLFNQGWFLRKAMQTLGAFSIHREGLDRQAINTAVSIVETAERPLVLFPEGTASRINDRVLPMLDGVAFIARTAAKRRLKSESGKVVIHPIAIKYLFTGDIHQAVDPVLDEIEKRFTWRNQSDRGLFDRIAHVGEALLTLKELEYLREKPGNLTLAERQQRMVEHLLSPLEVEWLGKKQSEGVISRIKAIRMKILPDMIDKGISDEERARRWRQIEDTYLAQQISCYPENYLNRDSPSIDRLLETVERFEEDLTDRVTVHGNLKVVMHIDEAIEVSPDRVRGAKADPLMVQIRERLEYLLGELSKESRRYTGP